MFPVQRDNPSNNSFEADGCAATQSGGRRAPAVVATARAAHGQKRALNAGAKRHAPAHPPGRIVTQLRSAA